MTVLSCYWELYSHYGKGADRVCVSVEGKVTDKVGLLNSPRKYRGQTKQPKINITLPKDI